MKKAALIVFVVALLAISCKESEKALQYYQTPYTYDIVNVQMPPVTNEVKNVIIMIGDGMGLEQVSCAWVLNKGKLNFDNFPYVGLSRTWCTNELITDSGAGGTALAAGVKTAYSHVGPARHSSLARRPALPSPAILPMPPPATSPATTSTATTRKTSLQIMLNAALTTSPAAALTGSPT